MAENEPTDDDLAVYDDVTATTWIDDVTATTWIDGVLTRYGSDGQELKDNPEDKP